MCHRGGIVRASRVRFGWRRRPGDGGRRREATHRRRRRRNRGRRARSTERGVKYLLQCLLVCACCGYAYYGKPISPSARKGRPRAYAYYRCIGSDAHRFAGQRLCYNKQVRTDRLEQAVWQEVCRLLEDPHRLAEEYQRRLKAVQAPPGEADLALVEKQIARLRQGIVRLIDAYDASYSKRVGATRMTQ